MMYLDLLRDLAKRGSVTLTSAPHYSNPQMQQWILRVSFMHDFDVDARGDTPEQAIRKAYRMIYPAKKAIA